MDVVIAPRTASGTRSSSRAVAVALLVATAACSEAPRARVGPDRATVPLLVEGNRPFVDVALRKADGTTRVARFLVDTGGGGFLMLESLAREIGLAWGETTREEGSELAHATSAPAAFVGDFALELDPERVIVLLGKDDVLPPSAPGRAEGMLPGHVLARCHVVFDHPRAEMTIAVPGALVPRGRAQSMPVSPRSGFARTEIEVDGVAHGMLVDTGASFTMVSEVLLNAWGAAHPDWPRENGAAGDAATLGGQALETLTLPGAAWGGLPIGAFGVVSQKEGTFERWISSMTRRPVEGSLAGNVLTRGRIELDYANETLYVELQK